MKGFGTADGSEKFVFSSDASFFVAEGGDKMFIGGVKRVA